MIQSSDYIQVNFNSIRKLLYIMECLVDPENIGGSRSISEEIPWSREKGRKLGVTPS